MTYQIAYFTNTCQNLIMAAIPKITRATVKTRLATISTALGTDTRTHDVMLQSAPAALATWLDADAFSSRINLEINCAIGNNIPQATIKTALDALTTGFIAGLTPRCCRAPKISATSLSVAAGGVASVTDWGDWNFSDGIIYTYQWTRDGSNIAAATAASYTLVGADATHTVRCILTATNADGNSSATSNGLAIVA